MTSITIDSEPSGAEITIDDDSGITPEIIDIVMSLSDFRDICITSESVSCDWDVLKGYLENQTIGMLWWDLTDNERYSIADTAVRAWTTTLHTPHIAWIRSGEDNCEGGVEDWRIAMCLPNTIIRYTQFGECRASTSACYYRDNDIEHCYCEQHFHLPVHVVFCVTPVGAEPGFGHAMAAVQVKEDINDLHSYYIFQYGDYNLQPGCFHIPINQHDELFLSVTHPKTIQSCGGYTCGDEVTWHFINGELI